METYIFLCYTESDLKENIRKRLSMDLFPLWNSLRIAVISSVIVFFLGIFFAYYVAKLPRLLKGALDVILTLPLVLPPTVVSVERKGM